MRNRSNLVNKAGGLCAIAAVGAGLFALSGTTHAAAANFADPTTINVFQHASGITGLQDVTATWTNINNGGGITYGAFRAIDDGYYATQLGFSSQSASNSAALQITLADPIYLNKFVATYQSSHRPVQYRILTSTTGFGAMTEAVGWTPYSTTISNLGTPVPAKYVQYEFLGTQDTQYFIMGELQAYAAPGQNVNLRQGYNLLQYAAAAGPNPDTALMRGGWRSDSRNPNNTWDGNVSTHLIGSTTEASFFVLPLNDVYTLRGAAVGFWHGQVWAGGLMIDVTTDATVTAGTVWQNVYTQAGTIDSAYLPFTTGVAGVNARFVRVRTGIDANGGGALSEFELFAIPEPANLALLGLAGMWSMRRRRH